MKRVYLLPNFVTAFGLACGLFVIFKVNLADDNANMYHMLHTATLVLLLAALADFLDGALARIVKAESDFGIMFDSLADAISFGVAPSVLFLKSIDVQQGTFLSFCAIAAAMIFTICGVLRLVRFSVGANAPREDIIHLEEKQKNFTGLPIPAAAGVVVSVNLFLLSPHLHHFVEISTLTLVITMALVIVVAGFLMISRWKFPSLKTLRFRLPSLHLIVWTVLLGLIILYGLLYFFPALFMLLSVGYLLLGCVLSSVRMIAGKRAKFLEDFEPEEDDNER